MFLILGSTQNFIQIWRIRIYKIKDELHIYITLKIKEKFHVFYQRALVVIDRKATKKEKDSSSVFVFLIKFYS